jgi:catechol 2,3-dioxygenase-like lactoylglutathione lyase family enzyme
MLLIAMLTHLRIARATNHLDEILRFYCDGLGFEQVGEFRDHDGFDGAMLGHAGVQYHLEFTREQNAPAVPAPGQDSLLVFYLEDAETFRTAVTRLESLGHMPVKSHNPFWDRKGRTYEDADGYRVVLYQGGWENQPHRDPQQPRSES